MTATRPAPSPSEERRFGEFLDAEQAVWDHYGLAPQEKFVDIGRDSVVRVHDVGEGYPILFVHGSGGSGVYWAPLVKELANHFRCILIDRPGWTQSTPIDYSTDDFGTIAATLQAALLTSLGIERAHVVGGSIGDLFALRLAQFHPDRVNKVVLVGGGPLVDAIEPPTFIRLLRSPLGQIMIRVPQKPGMIRKQMEGLGHQISLDNGLIPDELIDIYAATSSYTNAMRHERDLVRSILGSKGWVPGVTLSDADLAGITASTFMVYGSEDPVGSADIWEQFVGSMPNATLYLAPESGHLAWYDFPNEVAALVRSQLASS